MRFRAFASRRAGDSRNPFSPSPQLPLNRLRGDGPTSSCRKVGDGGPTRHAGRPENKEAKRLYFPPIRYLLPTGDGDSKHETPVA